LSLLPIAEANEQIFLGSPVCLTILPTSASEMVSHTPSVAITKNSSSSLITEENRKKVNYSFRRREGEGKEYSNLYSTKSGFGMT